MKVILLQELKGKGGEGDVVEVARGHAVNLLFPKKIAIEATPGNLKQLEARKHNIAKREAGRLESADALVAALGGKAVVVKARVGEEGQLFGSVTAMQIAEAIQEQFGIEVDRKKINAGHIKTAGQHPIFISIYREIRAALMVDVVDENAGAAEPEEQPEDVEASEAGEAGEEAAEAAEESAEDAEAEQEIAGEMDAAIGEAVEEEVAEAQPEE
jgi:large subunit ribosomal protein L9